MTTEDESSSDGEPLDVVPYKKALTLAELKKKKTMKPFASISAQRAVNAQSKHRSSKIDESQKGYNFLKLLKLNQTHSNYIYSVIGLKENIQRKKDASLDSDLGQS